MFHRRIRSIWWYILWVRLWLYQRRHGHAVLHPHVYRSSISHLSQHSRGEGYLCDPRMATVVDCLYPLCRHLLRSACCWRYCRHDWTSLDHHRWLHRLLRWGRTAGGRHCLWSSHCRTLNCRIWGWVCVRNSDSVHVRDRSPKSQRRNCERISILHHCWHPPG